MSVITQIPRLVEVNFALVRNNHHAFYTFGLDGAGKPLPLTGARLVMHIKAEEGEDAEAIKVFDSDDTENTVKIQLADLIYSDGETYSDSRMRFFFDSDITESELTAASYRHQVDYYTPIDRHKYSILRGVIKIEEQDIKYPVAP